MGATHYLADKAPGYINRNMGLEVEKNSTLKTVVTTNIYKIGQKLHHGQKYVSLNL